MLIEQLPWHINVHDSKLQSNMFFLTFMMDLVNVCESGEKVSTCGYIVGGNGV